jgi:broad-specificity NMP kinase
MQKCGFAEPKLYENLAAEILDNCLIEALQYQKETGKVCEINATGKTVDNVVSEILNVLETGVCHNGFIDWLGTLEEEGKLDEYLKS